MTKESRRALFATPDSTRRPLYYFTLPPADTANEQMLAAEVARCAACGFSALIPQLAAGTETAIRLFTEVRRRARASGWFSFRSRL